MHLKIGDKAPELNVKDQDGIIHSLADYKGKKLCFISILKMLHQVVPLKLVT